MLHSSGRPSSTLLVPLPNNGGDTQFKGMPVYYYLFTDIYKRKMINQLFPKRYLENTPPSNYQLVKSPLGVGEGGWGIMGRGGGRCGYKQAT